MSLAGPTPEMEEDFMGFGDPGLGDLNATNNLPNIDSGGGFFVAGQIMSLIPQLIECICIIIDT